MVSLDLTHKIVFVSELVNRKFTADPGPANQNKQMVERTEPGQAVATDCTVEGWLQVAGWAAEQPEALTADREMGACAPLLVEEEVPCHKTQDGMHKEGKRATSSS